MITDHTQNCKGNFKQINKINNYLIFYDGGIR